MQSLLALCLGLDSVTLKRNYFLQTVSQSCVNLTIVTSVLFVEQELSKLWLKVGSEREVVGWLNEIHDL